MTITACRALAAAGLVAAGNGAPAAGAPFEPIPESAISPAGERILAPLRYATSVLDVDALGPLLASAPEEAAVHARESPVRLAIPMPDGTSAVFRVVRSPVMAPELAERFPEIQTYLGQGVTDPGATVRFDLVPGGFHAIVFGSSGVVLVDPYQRNDARHHISYYRRDAARAGVDARLETGCTLHATADAIRSAEELVGASSSAFEPARRRTGDELRRYRVAIGATGEYTQYHGGTVEDGMEAIVVALNRVNAVYEREVAVRLELVANNDQIVFTDGTTDPYQNNSGTTMLAQNQATCDAVIGVLNYDIGHVFSTGGGGVAALGVVCETGSKAQGVTGLPAPIGDVFYVDYVAHEMGHQFNATHTFNGNAGACAGGNRTAGTAYEPGSGTTIMAYAGICSPQNTQSRSDEFFHNASLVQITAFTQSGGASSCPVVTPTGNSAPTSDATQPISFVQIPLDTPFMLTGTGTDPDGGDQLTYSWEQWDLGPAGHPNAPSGNAPIFRSFPPSTSPTRVFPRWSDLIDNKQTIGEILPSYSRFLRFRLTVRDNAAGGGGHGWDEIVFQVNCCSGPFEVASPNTAITVNAGDAHTVTWLVAGTTDWPVDCQSVDVLLSTDGGFTYPYLLASGTPNDGSEGVEWPAVATPTARVMVRAADHVFFDISDTSFEITTPVAVGDPLPIPSGATAEILGAGPNPFNPMTHVSFSLAAPGTATLRIHDALGRLVATLANGEIEAGVHTRSWDGRDLEGRDVASGVYVVRLEANGSEDRSRIVLAR